MLNRARLRDIGAKVHYRLCRSLGVPFMFSNRSQTPVQLYGAFLNPQVISKHENGNVTEYWTATFEIAVNQTGFPPQNANQYPVTTGDECIYNGVNYFVDEGGIENIDGLGAVFTCHCTSEKRISSGIS